MRTEQNLVLTGFMGTGKTTVGRKLAQMLGMEFVDTDSLIEERHGPIPRIFAEQGETRFRSIERSVAEELGEKSGLVIATGGGMVLDPENLRALSQNGRIFCLVASPAVILARVTNERSRRGRPLLHGDDPGRRIVDLLTERRDVYLQFDQVSTDDATPDEIANEVADLWRHLEDDPGKAPGP